MDRQDIPGQARAEHTSAAGLDLVELAMRSHIMTRLLVSFSLSLGVIIGNICNVYSGEVDAAAISAEYSRIVSESLPAFGVPDEKWAKARMQFMQQHGANALSLVLAGINTGLQTTRQHGMYLLMVNPPAKETTDAAMAMALVNKGEYTSDIATTLSYLATENAALWLEVFLTQIKTDIPPNEMILVAPFAYNDAVLRSLETIDLDLKGLNRDVVLGVIATIKAISGMKEDAQVSARESERAFFQVQRCGVANHSVVYQRMAERLIRANKLFDEPFLKRKVDMRDPLAITVAIAQGTNEVYPYILDNAGKRADFFAALATEKGKELRQVVDMPQETPPLQPLDDASPVKPSLNGGDEVTPKANDKPRVDTRATDLTADRLSPAFRDNLTVLFGAHQDLVSKMVNLQTSLDALVGYHTELHALVTQAKTSGAVTDPVVVAFTQTYEMLINNMNEHRVLQEQDLEALNAIIALMQSADLGVKPEGSEK
jgi:hypothetical protein